jgi:hypothetical protein
MEVRGFDFCGNHGTHTTNRTRVVGTLPPMELVIHLRQWDEIVIARKRCVRELSCRFANDCVSAIGRANEVKKCGQIRTFSGPFGYLYHNGAVSSSGRLNTERSNLS